MIKSDFVKVFQLASFNQQFFSLSEQDTSFKKFLKFILLIVFSPVYLMASAIIFGMYFSKELLSIPSKLVNVIRTNNTPIDNNNLMPFNVTYIILYLFIVPYDACIIFSSWIISLLSLFIDFIGKIVCLGNRRLIAYELCFETPNDNETFTKKHFWLTLLGIVLLILIFIIGNKLSMSIATTYEKLNIGNDIISVPKFNQNVYVAFRYIFITLAYIFPTILLSIIYKK